MTKTAPIYFNVKKARQYLLEKGHVYTIRGERSTGTTVARAGNYFIFKVLGNVEIERIKSVGPISLQPDLSLSDKGLKEYFDELMPYIRDSGFESPREWWGNVTMSAAKTCILYHVRLLDGKGDQ